MSWILIFGAAMLAWSSLSIMGSERDRLEREAEQKRTPNAAAAAAATPKK
jgi:threonine/homoserine/homoserine lactone efflux protein